MPRAAGEAPSPDIAFDVPQCLTAIATHGRGKEETDRIGDGTRMCFETSIPSVLPGLKAVQRFDFYALDTADRTAIEQQLDAVRRHFSAGW